MAHAIDSAENETNIKFPLQLAIILSVTDSNITFAQYIYEII